jgi:hypothetical protein
MVHRREIDGREIVLGNHGALFGNAMTWYDHETGSVWSQPLGEAILGPLTGARLELLPSTLTTWADWKAAHPDTHALDAPGGISGFDLDTMAVVVELGDASVAHPVPDVRTAGVANTTVGDVPVAVHVAADRDDWSVLSRTLDDRTVELEVVEPGTAGPTDDQAGTSGRTVLGEVGGPGRWDAASGLAIDGSGQNLDLLPGFTSFPRDYLTFFPSGAFWQPDGMVPVAEILGR